jgi:magnesium chelatase family protein
MLARRLAGLLPPLSLDEALMVTTIHSVAGTLPAGRGLIRRRPFRAPHHTCSDIALVGGGSVPRPGELSLAHGGVLFLDELPEFSRRVLETLRQPLEEGAVHIARASGTTTYPSEILLVAAMNSCPCGYHGSDVKLCTCPPMAVERYRQRLSGPLRDRFDLSLDLPAVPWADLRGPARSESSASVRTRVIDARRRQDERQGEINARLAGRELERVCRLGDAAAESLLERAAGRFQLSARGIARVLRVARTIADLSASPIVTHAHLAEALQFRIEASA